MAVLVLFKFVNLKTGIQTIHNRFAVSTRYYYLFQSQIYFLELQFLVLGTLILQNQMMIVLQRQLKKGTEIKTSKILLFVHVRL